MSVYLIVKSDTSQIDNEDFDHWYENEHLYEAKKQFVAINAKRGWIQNSNSHIAIYEFENIHKAENAMNSKKLQSLIKKFDQKWGFKVVRTRELVNLTQII